MLQAIVILSFMSAVMLSFSVLKPVFGNASSIGRLRRYTAIEELRKERNKGDRGNRGSLGVLARGVENMRFLEGYKKKLQLKLSKAQIMLKADEFISVCLIVFFSTGLFIFLITFNALIAVAAAVVSWFIPGIVVGMKIKKRVNHINDQLTDAIVLISNSLKAGYSFFQAIDTVAKEMSGPIAYEFMLLQKEINLGTTTEKALENLVERIKSDDLELVVTAVLIQRQVGGNLAEVLDNISTTIRDRLKIKGEIKTLTAQGKMSGFIIALLPPSITGILFLISPDYISVLFTHPIGIGLLVLSVMLELTGVYFISRIIKIEI